MQLLTAHSTQKKSAISMLIKDFIHHHHRTLFYDSFTTRPGRDAVLRHAPAGMQFYDTPRPGGSFTTCPGRDAVLR